MDKYELYCGFHGHTVKNRDLKKPQKERLKDTLPKSVIDKIYDHILASGYDHMEWNGAVARPNRIRIEWYDKDTTCKEWNVRVVVDYDCWDEDTEDASPLAVTKAFIFRIGY